MASGNSELSNLMFLDKPSRVRSWVSLLGRFSLTDSTRQHYVKNAFQFFDYLSETPPESCLLSARSMVSVKRELKSLLRGLRRKVVLHEMRVKSSKEERLISKADLLRCHDSAGREIPLLLGQYLVVDVVLVAFRNNNPNVVLLFRYDLYIS